MTLLFIATYFNIQFLSKTLQCFNSLQVRYYNFFHRKDKKWLKKFQFLIGTVLPDIAPSINNSIDARVSIPYRYGITNNFGSLAVLGVLHRFQFLIGTVLQIFHNGDIVKEDCFNSLQVRYYKKEAMKEMMNDAKFQFLIGTVLPKKHENSKKI